VLLEIIPPRDIEASPLEFASKVPLNMKHPKNMKQKVQEWRKKNKPHTQNNGKNSPHHGKCICYV
jgi:hypothetical protein